MHKPLCQECRGLILDSYDYWKPIAYPFKKFWNVGDTLAAPVDLSNCSVYEKIDGSLMILYHYRDKWHVATRGKPDASGQVHGYGQSFADYFWEVWTSLAYQMPKETNLCFMFEMCTPHNRIVVRYDEFRLDLIGIRDMFTLKELVPDMTWRSKYNWNVASPLLLLGDHALQVVDGKSGFQREGFVLVDRKFNRVKVKSEDYKRLHRLWSSMSPRNILSVLLNSAEDQVDELVNEFSEVKRYYYTLNAKIQEIWGVYQTLRDIDDQKSFALEATKHPFSGALFGLRSGKFKTVIDALRSMTLPKLEKLIGGSQK
jgi:hypothetical protein